MANTAIQQDRRPVVLPVARAAGSVLDRLFTPHGASAYLRWIGLAPAARDLDGEQLAASDADAVAVAVDRSRPYAGRGPVDGAGRSGRRPPTAPTASIGPSRSAGPSLAAEAVGPDGSVVSARDPQAVGAVRFEASGLSAVAEGTLLETAEAAGLAPRNRCRRGICGTCTTPKFSGTVLDARTGETSDAAGPIRICVSIAQGDVSLDL